MSESQYDPTKMRDVTISIQDSMTPMILWSVVLFIVPVLPYLLIWGFPASWSFGFGEILLVFLGLALLVVAHEAVHALGWMIFGGARVSDINFGFAKETLSPYAHAHIPMKASQYRIGVVLPLIITGILPTVIGTLIGHGWLTFLGVFLITGAVGDMFVLWAIRSVPDDARVLDHPTAIGCYVLNDEPA